MGISKQSIEDLKKRSKISDFVLSTTTGKLRGTKGMALCPFHGEKTASMSFTDVENLFHCLIHIVGINTSNNTNGNCLKIFPYHISSSVTNIITRP